MRTDDLTRLFDAERAASPPAGGLERGLDRLLNDVMRGAAPLPVAATSLKLGLSLASKWLAVGFVVGLSGAGAASQIWAQDAAAAPSAPARLVAAAAPAPASVPAASPSAEPATLAPEAAPLRVVRGVASIPPPEADAEPTKDAARLSEELRLIAAAKREMELDKYTLAAAWLAEHAARFPNGVFATDREALRILVQCSERKDPALARRFAMTHPSSPIVERLERACSASAAGAPSAGDFPKLDK